MSRALQYYHCIAASGMNWTIEPGAVEEKVASQVDALRSFVDNLPEAE